MPADRQPILTRIAAGDPGAVAACLDEYGGMVAALAERYLRPLGLDQDDAVQEIFVEVWKHAARYSSDSGSEAAFIATVAHRRLIDRQRRHSTQAVVVRARQPLDGLDRLFTSARSGRRSSEEAREAVEAFSRLTPDERQAVWLTICQGYSHERASTALSTPLGTVKTRVRRALVRMREFLVDQRAQAENARPGRGAVAMGNTRR